ncbi:unnamed protein product [Albugo candida]|uniref:Protein kinase domain-containing protein n=1 Tax=Albugo candida TaxID=65357 RepID=A0A024GEP3_9STRA|nr:unnamed protein product [Albugo candida]|eukprot:CCI45164.1 unnamed protein product [Albugo candida]
MVQTNRHTRHDLSSADAASAYIDQRIQQIQKRIRTELGFQEISVGSKRRVTTDSLTSSSSSGRPAVQMSRSSETSEGFCNISMQKPQSSLVSSKEARDCSNQKYSRSIEDSMEASPTPSSFETDSMMKRLNAEYCTECIKGTVYVSPSYERKQRLLVIIPYREACIWSRSICMQKDSSAQDDLGSMMGYLRKAISEEYGVIIMNPAAQSCHPQNHVEQVWDQLVVPLSSDIFIIAFSRGTQHVKHLLSYDNGMGIVQERVRALSLVEPSHYVHESDLYFTRRILARRAVAWILSPDIDVGLKIPSAEARHGCVCISAGTVPVNAKGSSGAWALEMVMTSVFGSFAARCGEAAGVTVNDNRISACGLCHRRLGVLNRKFQCSWCEVRYCSRCCEDKHVETFDCMRICILCQVLPCLLDPYRKQKIQFLLSGESLGSLHDTTEFNRHDNISVFVQPNGSFKVSLADFEIIKLIGRGACGRVKLVRKKHGTDEGILYAMKAIRKKLIVQRGLVEATNAERRILDRIKHPYIATLCYAFQNDAKLYLLSKYYPGGNLLDQMRLARRFTEDRTKLYAAEVALALDHLHSNDIMYRDLKLENVLVGSDGHIALTDFGMSKECMTASSRTSTFVGTYQMMAPEVFTGRPYSRAVDWWALGVMVYEMIDGRTPFNAKTNRLIRDRITNVDLKFSSRFADDASDFVARLLTKDERKRLGSGPQGFKDIQSHPWFASIDWDKVEAKEATFYRQSELMLRYAKEFRTREICETFMNAVEVPADTPVSAHSSRDEDLFSDFTFNYIAETEPSSPSISSCISSTSFKTVEFEELEGTCSSEANSILSYTEEIEEKNEDASTTRTNTTMPSHFDTLLLRPQKALDFRQTVTPFTSLCVGIGEKSQWKDTETDQNQHSIVKDGMNSLDIQELHDRLKTIQNHV